MKSSALFPKIMVTTGGRGVCSHLGSRLLADVGAAAGLAEAFDDEVGGYRQRRSAHRPGRVLTDLAVLLADGGQSISDLAALRDQPELFGSVASTATAWRVLDAVDDAGLEGLKTARAMARERAWMLRAEAGRALPRVRCAGREVPGLVIDVDATLVTCHSEKQHSAATFEHGFGYHLTVMTLRNSSLVRCARAQLRTAGLARLSGFRSSLTTFVSISR